MQCNVNVKIKNVLTSKTFFICVTLQISTGCVTWSSSKKFQKIVKNVRRCPKLGRVARVEQSSV